MGFRLSRHAAIRRAARGDDTRGVHRQASRDCYSAPVQVSSLATQATMPQLDWQGIVALIVFAAAILLIAVDAIDLTLAVIIGDGILIASGVTTVRSAVGYIAEAHETIALFFGGMVLVRAFAPTGVFEWIGVRVYQLSRGSGKRLLLGIVMIIAPVCAVLPNATTVILLAPVLIRIAEYFETDFVPLLFLLVFVANSSGLLTLIGDPATFVV